MSENRTTGVLRIKVDERNSACSSSRAPTGNTAVDGFSNWVLKAQFTVGNTGIIRAKENITRYWDVVSKILTVTFAETSAWMSCSTRSGEHG